MIGGVAVGYHGHIRATKDLDVVPAPDRDNLQRLATVLERLDADVEGSEEFDPRAIEDSIGGLPIKIVSYGDLVRLKELAGRPEDLADLERLR